MQTISHQITFLWPYIRKNFPTSAEACSELAPAWIRMSVIQGTSMISLVYNHLTLTCVMVTAFSSQSIYLQMQEDINGVFLQERRSKDAIGVLEPVLIQGSVQLQHFKLNIYHLSDVHNPRWNGKTQSPQNTTFTWGSPSPCIRYPTKTGCLPYWKIIYLPFPLLSISPKALSY